MTHESLLDRDWDSVVERLGGKETLVASAKATKAFLRARAFENAIDMLRMIFCLLPGKRRLALYRGVGSLYWARRRGQYCFTLPLTSE
jgi:hypothetical protein